MNANPPSAVGTNDDDAPLCPVCGYDLRGTDGDRCSECGSTIDRESLKTSGFPWAHRREIGRVWAYIKTVWMVTIGSRKLKYEASRPQELRDGRSFARVTAVILAIGMVAPFAAAVVAAGLGSLGVQPQDMLTGWLQDVLVPWSSGITILPVVPLALVLFAFYLTGAQRRLFRFKDVPTRRQERATAIAYYSAAPLAWLLPAMLCGMPEVYSTVAASIVAAYLFLAAATLGTLARVVHWACRVRHRGFEVVLWAVPGLLGLWLLGLLSFVGILPWCIGYLRIIVDSLR